ncbi:MAG: serine/threonine-protein kinase [Steroidobacteraceae bacterium]
MESELWRRVADLFDAALERPPGERRPFLEKAAQGDGELLTEVSRLLAEFEKAGEFLEGSVFQARQAFSVGQRVGGRYTIEALLGRGGMGEVYRAHDDLVGERVALKTLRPDLGGDADFLKRFRSEVHLARKVTHPSVCRIFDLGVHGEDTDRPVHFFSMQLLEGETLAALLHREKRLTTETALPIARQVADGLDAAHHAGITHGDLKSANVMFHGDRAVITDFGLARFSPAVGPMPEHSSMAGLRLAGTIAYMSPEQLEGDPTTSASDVYSFGVLLFEMLVGKPPFNDSHLLRSAMQRVTSAAPDIRGMAPELERSWAEVITRCLRRDPLRRFTSAGAAVTRLRPGAHSVLPNFSRRQWLLAAAGTGAAALAGVALIPAGLRFYSKAPVLPEGAEIVLGTIANLTNDERLEAATELFRNQLGQSTRVHLVEGTRLQPVLQQMGVANDAQIDPKAIREAAWRVNASLTVFGTIARVGADYVLNVQIETRGPQPDRPHSRLLRSFSSPDPRALMSSFRDATLWVREVAGETDTTIAQADVLPEDATTQSWKALAYYAKGQQLFLNQLFGPAVDRFDEALAEDPRFTLAALRRSDLLMSLNRQVDGFESYKTAMKLLDERPVTRPEELYGRGMFALDSGDYETADRHFRTWSSDYPFDWRAPFYRMLPLCMNGHVEQAVELLERLRPAIPDYGDLYVQLVRAKIMEGKTDEARVLLPDIRRLNRPQRAALQEAAILFREGDCVGCLELLRGVQRSTSRRSAADAMIVEGLLLIDAGYPEAAAANVERFLSAGSWTDARPFQIVLQVVQAWAEMLSGRSANAIENARRAVADEAAPLIVALAGTIFARSGATALAENAQRMTERVEGVPIYRMAALRIAGELARHDGNNELALEHLRNAAALEPAIAHRQYLIEALPAGSDERLSLATSALRFPWQNLRPPPMYHIGAIGIAVADVRAAGIQNAFAAKFIDSAKALEAKL